MLEYDLQFAREMSQAGKLLFDHQQKSGEATDRAVLYISLVACEVAMKSLLENAGMSLKTIRAQNHSLDSLLQSCCQCKPRVKGSSVSASALRAKVVDKSFSDATVGNLLEGESNGASKFPNEIRYGETLKHYPPQTISMLSKVVIDWVEDHIDKLKY